jgi:DNA-directed RNA polymerase subunit E'/Rpb7
MLKIVSPYKNIKQYTKILIEPFYMNSDIRNNMKIVLKKKVEHKCNKNGFVDIVHKIIDYSDGFMPVENLNGAAIYNITYHCKICIPIENTYIIAQVKVINSEIIVGVNGPIMVFIPKEYIDSNTWISNDGLINKKSKNKLKVGNYIIVMIVNKKINLNDSQIKTIGQLIDVATDEQVESFFGSDIIDSIEDDISKVDESNFII